MNNFSKYLPVYSWNVFLQDHTFSCSDSGPAACNVTPPVSLYLFIQMVLVVFFGFSFCWLAAPFESVFFSPSVHFLCCHC